MRSLLAVLLITGALGCTGQQLRDNTPTVLRGAAATLEALAEDDSPAGILRAALDLLRMGDTLGCCDKLHAYLDQVKDDPRVRAVLELIESEIT